MTSRRALAAPILAASLASWAAGAEAVKPNVVVFLADDVGYADLSFQGPSDFSTPRIDSIAEGGVRFTAGYVTASVCSPSRAGLLSGRYQQRFGHEHNLHAHHGKSGIPDDTVLLAEVLARHGYRTIAVGKWHLGASPSQHPLRHGFSDFHGFLKGQRSYLPLSHPPKLSALQEAGEAVPERFEYLTDELGRRAAAYVDAHHERPFFLYVSFSAVHVPMEARPDVLEGIGPDMPDERRVLAAMTASLDAAVGRVLDRLDAHGIREKTLVFFLNDNGGAVGNASSNEPLRGHKGTSWEGGIRVPFAMQWPGVLPAGRIYGEPVIALDVFPTVLAATCAKAPEGPRLDGVDLLPFVTGTRDGRPHETLFWRRGATWAIRHGDWKLVSIEGATGSREHWLFDLSRDPGETRDRAPEERQRVKEMSQRYRKWARSLKPPRWEGTTPTPPKPRRTRPRPPRERRPVRNDSPA